MPGASIENNKARSGGLYDLTIAINRILSTGKSFLRRQTIEQLWSHQNLNGSVLLIIETGTLMGFEAVTYARSTILKDYIKDVRKAFQSPTTKNAGSFANPPIEKEPGTIIAPVHEPNLEHSHVTFRQGIDRRADTKNKINPTIDDFRITPFNGEQNTPIQSPYTVQQLRNYSLTLLRIILPPIKRDWYLILELRTPMGSIEHCVVPKSLRKLEYSDARKSGWDDFWTLGANACTSRNIKIDGGSMKAMSKFVTIKDPSGTRVTTIVKDKTTTFLRVKKKAARL
ncbi:hypothetical protein L873DRAFT_1795737 [Choiromyces venosus 120613-1]|uniref:Uncharacterized protein n=1 Tax=Choiromyces venosus 120613-1 TaxID=1336337 RepID=A0A3N4J0F2_9PEZI|nr:hypothetical protein L873DRAFT_1795737 [Choiromyces venosus 120613-1]